MADDERPRSKGISPPLCKLCGVAHWFREPHVFKAEPAPKKAAVATPKAKPKGGKRAN